MQNPFSTPTAQNFGLLLARISCGACFMLMGYHHLSGEGPRSFVNENMGHIPHWMGARAGESYLTLVPFAELTFGALLTLGVMMRMSAFFLGLMLVSFMIVIPSLSAEKYPFHPNIILFGVAFAILTNGGGNMTLPHILGKSSGGGGGKPAPAK